jgi:hypothetical protein
MIFANGLVGGTLILAVCPEKTGVPHLFTDFADVITFRHRIEASYITAVFLNEAACDNSQ